jgi:SulP family sulfate permease
MARVKSDLRDPLHAAGFLEKLGEDRIFATLPTALMNMSAGIVDGTDVLPMD